MIYTNLYISYMEKKKETRGRKKLGNRPVKSKGSKRKPKPPIETIQKVLKDHFGIITECAETLGITTATLYNWINSSTKLTETFRESRNLMLDFTESRHMENIRKGKEPSIIFTLKTIGRHRGWIEREPNDNSQLNIGNAVIQINYVLPEGAEPLQLPENIIKIIPPDDNKC